MKNNLFVIALFLPLFAAAQDGTLVLNPGFEKLKPNGNQPICAYGQNAEHFENTLQNWTTFGGMTPDLIIWKPDAYGDCFFPKPHGGDMTNPAPTPIVSPASLARIGVLIRPCEPESTRSSRPIWRWHPWRWRR